MGSKTDYDDVFGIEYETESRVREEDSNKVIKESKVVDEKDDIFTQQILNSSPYGKTARRNSKENLKDVEVEDDIFTEQILSSSPNGKSGLTSSKKNLKDLDAKDVFFTEQTLTSSPYEKTVLTDSKKNLESKKSDNEDFFTEQILSNYKPLNTTLEEPHDNQVPTNNKIFNENKKHKKNKRNVNEEYSMFDVKEVLENSSKEEKSLKNIITKPLFIDEGDYGIKMIKQMIDNCWTYDKKKLAEYMANRVIFDDDSLIAFDKPVSLAYSGKTKNDTIITMDSCLQELKKIVAPDISRLSLVRSLEKGFGGIILFAKTKEAQDRYLGMIENNLITFKYHALVRGIPASDEGTIKFPLVKLLSNRGDIVVKPFKQEKFPKKGHTPVMFASTDYKVLETNKRADMSFLQVSVNKEYVHQIRTHLVYGLNTPIIGDVKYNPLNTKNIIHPPKLTNEARNLLDISSSNGYKQLPMLCHLYKASFPGKQQSGTENFNIFCSMPPHMKFILRKLKLLKR
uniref:Pseudouridylate synthase RPUSD4, mitochondrial n=1 Tax=Strongyloides papillosus TaxID=174720 RepID=A0A0N5B2G7_STREA